MKNINKVKLGFCFSVIAFALTISAQGTQGFRELNPFMSILIANLNGYHLVLFYGFLWTVILTLQKWADKNLDPFYSGYTANIVLMMGFFDFVHNVIILFMI